MFHDPATFADGFPYETFRTLRADEIPPLAPGRYLQLKISDSGPGISTKQRQHLFQKFSQVDASATRRSRAS